MLNTLKESTLLATLLQLINFTRKYFVIGYIGQRTYWFTSPSESSLQLINILSTIFPLLLHILLTLGFINVFDFVTVNCRLLQSSETQSSLGLNCGVSSGFRVRETKPARLNPCMSVPPLALPPKPLSVFFCTQRPKALDGERVIHIHSLKWF